MRPLEQLATHLRKNGKGKNKSYDIPMGGGYHTGGRHAVCVVLENGLNRFVTVTMKAREKGKVVRQFRKPTVEELSKIRDLFFYPHETVFINIYPTNRNNTVILIQQ